MENKTKVQAVVVFWVVCSVLSYGFMFGMFQREFPTLAEEDYRRDMIFSAITSIIGGPVMLCGMWYKGWIPEHGLKFI